MAEVRILGEGGSESHPRVKEVSTPNLHGSHDAVVGRLCCREQFRAKSITGGRGDMHQGLSCEEAIIKKGEKLGVGQVMLMREHIRHLIC